MSRFRVGDPYGQLKLPSDLGRSVLRGECLIRDPVNYYEGNLPGAATDFVFGFIEDEAGGDAGQLEPVRLLRRGEMMVRVQDNATVAAGAWLQPSASDPGSVVTWTGGTPCARALQAITSGTTGQYLLAEVFCDQAFSPVAGAGAAAAGSTAVEQQSGFQHLTTLAVSTTMPAIAGGANLAIGKLLYTFPAGVIAIHASHMSLALDEADGNITADTPDGGLGTVIASGVVAVLGGTGTFENILTGQTFNDCNGTVETVALAPTAGSPFLMNAADAHTMYFNLADGWAAGGEAALAVSGTVAILWSKLA